MAFTERGKEFLKGKKVKFRSGDKESPSESDFRVPTEVEAVLEEDTAPEYNRIFETWKAKNDFHAETEAYGRFAQEGGQELVGIFGAEKVASALTTLLAAPVDDRTGLYMLIRTLEPNLKKRQAVYDKMERAVDARAKQYMEGYRVLTSEQEKKRYREFRGGDYAPTADAARWRKIRIGEYRAFDQSAFSVVGAVWNAAMWTMNGEPSKGYAMRELQGRFDAGQFIRTMNDAGGDVGVMVASRMEQEVHVETALDELRRKRIAALQNAQRDHVERVQAPFIAQLEALARDEKMLFNAHAGLASEVPEVEDVLQEAKEEILRRGDAIVDEMEAVVRAAFPNEFAAIGKIRQKKARDEAWNAFRAKNAAQLKEIQAPFRKRITALIADVDRVFGPPKGPETAEGKKAIDVGKQMLQDRAQAIKREMQQTIDRETAKISEEIKKLQELDVYKDR